MSKNIFAIVLSALLVLALGSGCNPIPDEKEAIDFAQKYTTHYDSTGQLLRVDQKERDEAYTLFYSEKFATAVLNNDLKKAAAYAERVTVFYAVNGNDERRNYWIGLGKMVEQKKTDELKPIAQQIKADFDEKVKK